MTRLDQSRASENIWWNIITSKLENWGDWWCYTLNPILHQFGGLVSCSSTGNTGNTPMTVRLIYSLYFPVATHSFLVPSNLRSQLRPYILINMLAESCRWGTICKYQNGMPQVARKAYIREGWNPVCSHGNKTAKLIFMEDISTFHHNSTFKILSLGVYGPLYLVISSNCLGELHDLNGRVVRCNPKTGELQV